jgi:hypothetical protein
VFIVDTALTNQGMDLLEMPQLLTCQPGADLQQFRTVDIPIQQAQGGTGRLLFAVCVINEQQIHVVRRRDIPLFGGFAVQKLQHSPNVSGFLTGC